MAAKDKPEWPPLLRAGFHDLDMNGCKRLCVDRFPDSITRRKIMSNLDQSVFQINQQGISGEIWIDGSFLTEKLNPDDADIALVLQRPQYQSLSSLQRQFFHLFRGKSLYDQYRIDNYGVVLDLTTDDGLWMQSYWVKQFGFSRSNEGKGILRVRLPFVVTP